MPSFSSSSSIRATSQEHVLCLKITHNLVYGLPSDPVRSVKARLPKDLDVLWLSDVAICVSGSLDARQIPAHDVTRSGLAHHLYTLLKMNADRLGLNNVSRPFVDDADGHAKLTLTPSRPLPQPSRPHIHLVSLHLAYIWRFVAGSSDLDSPRHLVEKSSPFSPTLFLPIEVLLNRVTEQILIYHLVGRYPLIFGIWCKKLDLEMQYFPSISSSILEIISRSENRGFLSKCKRLFKTARSQHKFIFQASSAALSSVTNDTTFGSQKEGTDDPFAAPTLTDKQVVCESLGQLFRRGIPQRRFKPVPTPKFVLSPSDGDDELLQSVPDERPDDEASWVELPEIAMSPYASLADSLLPEDVGVFAEDRQADETWDRHEADTNSADAMLAPPEFIMCEAQSDESLIDAPVSLASITTRSPQAYSFTLYPHQNINYHELDPAASGSRKQRSQMSNLEEPESSVSCANLAYSPPWTPHDQCFSGEYQQLMEGFLDVSEGFEVVNDWSEDEGLESLLSEDETRDSFDVSLDWL